MKLWLFVEAVLLNNVFLLLTSFPCLYALATQMQPVIYHAKQV